MTILNSAILPTLRVCPVGDRKATHRALAAIMGSTAFEISPDARGFRLLGQDRRHHSVDPCLREGLSWLGIDHEAIATFRRRGPCFALCLEDSWSGWLLAATLGDLARNEPLVLIHLDDHTDLMPTLLTRHADGLTRDPNTGGRFDPRAPEAWETAIRSGTVTIGSWLTALVAASPGAPPVIHIRHLHPNGNVPIPAPRTLRAGTVRHTLVPEQMFVAVSEEGEVRGTWRTSTDPAECLLDLPEVPIVLHIDLDYFVNDFNGNPGASATVPDRGAVMHKMDRLFGALRIACRPVRQWIVATSPGFCCARHWPWLLEALESRIVKI